MKLAVASLNKKGQWKIIDLITIAQAIGDLVGPTEPSAAFLRGVQSAIPKCERHFSKKGEYPAFANCGVAGRPFDYCASTPGSLPRALWPPPRCKRKISKLNIETRSKYPKKKIRNSQAAPDRAEADGEAIGRPKPESLI